MPEKYSTEIARALQSLAGLSVGDAFGEQFFNPRSHHEAWLAKREPPPGPWPFTDDTVMALSIVSILMEYGAIDQDALAQSFGKNFNPMRGYGPAMHTALPAMSQGDDWKEIAHSLFNGEGSFGNGASMRVAPIGAFFADDILAVRRNAALSAEVTHAHPEAAAGAIAVSLAAAYANKLQRKETPTPTEFIELVVKGVPDSMIRRGILKAIEVHSDTPTREVAKILGSGQQVSTQDTVPYVIWCAAHFLSDYEDALWNTVAGYGDMDTTCAIVGGIVVMFTGERAIPPEWIERREELSELPL